MSNGTTGDDFEFQQGRRISEFPATPTFPAGTQLTLIADGVNYQMPLADFLSALNVTGVIESLGDGIPVYNNAGSVNQIRAIETLSGLFSQQGTSGNIQISDAMLTTLTTSSLHVTSATSEIIFCTVGGLQYEIDLHTFAATGDVVRIFSTASNATVKVVSTDGSDIIYRGAVVTGATGFILPQLRSITLRKAPSIWIQEDYDPA